MGERVPIPVAPLDAPPRRPRRSCLGNLGAVLAVGVGLGYLVFPSFGWLELIPDATPLLGSLDEAGATTLLLLGLRYLVRGSSERP